MATESGFNSELLKLLTINVWSGLTYAGTLRMGYYETEADREGRYRSLLSQIRELDPEVICINEANKLPAYARRLATDLEFNVVSSVAIGGLRVGPIGLPWNLREGDAILARTSLRLQSCGRRRLSGGYSGRFISLQTGDATQVVGANIRWCGRDVFVFATHWHSSILPTEKNAQKLEELARMRSAATGEVSQIEREIEAGAKWRARESQRTLEFVQRMAGDAPAILMGDFNALSGSPEITALRDAGFTDTFDLCGRGAGHTWDPASNANIRAHYGRPEDLHDAHADSLRTILQSYDDMTARRIDFIFVRNMKASGISVRESRLVLDQFVDGRHPSDHFGVTTALEFSPPNPI